MNIYISILRGINVTGKKLIKMKDLRELYTSLNFQNITSYIQSGNIIFSHTKEEEAKLQQKISKQIMTIYGFEVPVIVLSIQDLKQIIANNPFTKDMDKNPDFSHITFFSTKPRNVDVERIEAKKRDSEDIVITEKAAYLYCPKGYGKTKLNNSFLENVLKTTATTRNWKTTNKLLYIAEEIN